MQELIKAYKSLCSVKASNIVDAEIWMGSGYTKAPISFKTGAETTPASSKDIKTLAKAWGVDTDAIKGFIDFANDSSSDPDVVIAILTSTETHSLSTEDDGDDQMVGYDKKDSPIYYNRI